MILFTLVRCCLCLMLQLGIEDLPAMKQAKGVEMSAALESETINVGDPIVIRLTLHNASKSGLVLPFEDKQSPWVTFLMTDLQKNKVRRVLDYRPNVKVRIGGMRTTEYLNAGASREMQYVVSQFYEVRQAGKYLLTIKLQVPALEGDNSQPLIKQTKVLSLTVNPFSRHKSEDVAKKIYEKVLSTSGKQQQLEVQSLFSMPEPIALPYWKLLMQKVTRYTYVEVSEQLKRLSTPATLDLLEPLNRQTMIERANDPDYLQGLEIIRKYEAQKREGQERDNP